MITSVITSAADALDHTTPLHNEDPPIIPLSAYPPIEGFNLRTLCLPLPQPTLAEWPHNKELAETWPLHHPDTIITVSMCTPTPHQDPQYPLS